MLPMILYILAGLIVGAAVAYNYRPGDYAELPTIPAAVISVAAWPMALLVGGAFMVLRAGDRAQERKKELRDEQHRLLAIGEAELNRSGFYGDVVQQKQISHDTYNFGLYHHALTGPLE